MILNSRMSTIGYRLKPSGNETTCDWLKHCVYFTVNLMCVHLNHIHCFYSKRSHSNAPPLAVWLHKALLYLKCRERISVVSCLHDVWLNKAVCGFSGVATGLTHHFRLLLYTGWIHFYAVCHLCKQLEIIIPWRPTRFQLKLLNNKLKVSAWFVNTLLTCFTFLCECTISCGFS